MRVDYKKLNSTIEQILLNEGLIQSDAKLLAGIMSDSSLDGFQSHGVNRVPLFVRYLREGVVNPKAELELLHASGTFRQYDGNYGLGIKNAWLCTESAVELAKENGIGIAALKNTNHWHRAGTYGWKAAEANCILIAWTNCLPNLPPYGAEKNLIGNNPIVIAIPRKEGHIVLDMSFGQFSYGKVAAYARQGKELPVFGGFDRDGELTKDAAEIRNHGKHLPIGFWKGSNLAFVLDLVAAVLAGGRTTKQIGEQGGRDTGMSQVYIAIDPDKFSDREFREKLIGETINFYKEYNSVHDAEVRFPGEATLRRRKEYLEKGIPVEEEIWNKVQKLHRGE